MPLPQPQLGLVISYSYLWRRELERGQSEGLKERPCAIVLTVQDSPESGKIVTVAPITHTRPDDLKVAIELPAKVKQYLGLDDERSWIILDEFDEFTWPGFDLRIIRGNPGRYDYGLLPPSLFTRIIDRVLELRREGRIFSSVRD